MARPYFAGAGDAVGSTSAISLAWPVGHQADDIGLIFVECSGESTTLTTPSGWEAVPDSPVISLPTTSGSKLHAWWKRATSNSEPNVSIGDSGDHQYGKLFAIRNCRTEGNPFAQSSTWVQATAINPLVLPSITTTEANTLVVYCIASHTDSPTLDYNAGINSTLESLTRKFNGSTTQGNGGGFSVQAGIMATSGATGTTSIGYVGARIACAFILGFVPAPANPFPPLAPVSRSYSMGIFPVTTETGFGGGSIRFLHGSVSSGHTLELQYSNLTQAEAELIREHYRVRQGGYTSFLLSAEAWAGHTSATDLVPTTTRWKYASPPEEVQKKGGYVDLTVSLVSVI
jgi:hypothetical protein